MTAILPDLMAFACIQRLACPGPKAVRMRSGTELNKNQPAHGPVPHIRANQLSPWSMFVVVEAQLHLGLVSEANQGNTKPGSGSSAVMGSLLPDFVLTTRTRYEKI